MFGQIFRVAAELDLFGVRAVMTWHVADVTVGSVSHLRPDHAAVHCNQLVASISNYLQSGTHVGDVVSHQVAGDVFDTDFTIRNDYFVPFFGTDPCVPEIACVFHRYDTWSNPHQHGRIYFPFLSAPWFVGGDFRQEIAQGPTSYAENVKERMWGYALNDPTGQGLHEVIVTRDLLWTKISHYAFSTIPGHQRRRRLPTRHSLPDLLS